MHSINLYFLNCADAPEHYNITREETRRWYIDRAETELDSKAVPKAL